MQGRDGNVMTNEDNSQRVDAAKVDSSGSEVERWSESELAPTEGAQLTIDQMTNRLQTVIDAAERAAAAIRYDAEERARRHLEEAQRRADALTAERVRLIAGLTDDLIRHAGTVREHSERMIGGLDEAIDAVTAQLESGAFEIPQSALESGVISSDAEEIPPSSEQIVPQDAEVVEDPPQRHSDVSPPFTFPSAADQPARDASRARSAGSPESIQSFGPAPARGNGAPSPDNGRARDTADGDAAHVSDGPRFRPRRPWPDTAS